MLGHCRLRLEYPAVVQSQGDVVTRQGIQGQVLCELLAVAYLSALYICHPRLVGFNFCVYNPLPHGLHLQVH